MRIKNIPYKGTCDEEQRSLPRTVIFSFLWLTIFPLVTRKQKKKKQQETKRNKGQGYVHAKTSRK
jgi:hypothetical protein